MKKQIMFLSIVALIVVFAAGLLNTVGFAQKRFEGYMEQTTIRTSDMPMQPKKVTEKEKILAYGHKPLNFWDK